MIQDQISENAHHKFLLFHHYVTECLQDYVLTKRLLHGMLKKDAEQRLSLRDILLDKERRDCLINPRNEHWSDVM